MQLLPTGHNWIELWVVMYGAGTVRMGPTRLQPQPHLFIFLRPAALPQREGEAHQVHHQSLVLAPHVPAGETELLVCVGVGVGGGGGGGGEGGGGGTLRLALHSSDAHMVGGSISICIAHQLRVAAHSLDQAVLWAHVLLALLWFAPYVPTPEGIKAVSAL